MNLRPYLPSATFTVMVSSLALSVALVAGAQYITRPQQSVLDTAPSNPAAGDWQQSLRDLQAQSGIEAPRAPDPAAVSTMLSEAASSNLTTQVGRSILVNLGSQSAQGLGQDTPTQEQLIAQAAAQINASASTTSYTTMDLTVVPPGTKAAHAYGNAVMAIFAAHPEANAQDAYRALGQSVDNQRSDELGALSPIAEGYAAIVRDLLKTPVPQTLAPLHLKLVNDFAGMAASFPDMQSLISDPLRGMAAVQRYAALMDEAMRMLTSIAQSLNKDGILFTKDEPGSAWGGFLSS